MQMRDTLTIEEVARYLSLGRSAVYAAVKRGDIPGKKIGKQWRFYRPALEKMLTENEQHRGVRR